MTYQENKSFFYRKYQHYNNKSLFLKGLTYKVGIFFCFPVSFIFGLMINSMEFLSNGI